MKHDYNDIIQQMEAYFLSHPQVNSSDNGRDLEFDVKKIELFPRAFIKTLNSVYRGQWIYSFEIAVMDRLNSDRGNYDTVLNDMHLVAVDFISEFNFRQMLVPTQPTLTPLDDYADTQTAGWVIAVEILSELGLGCYV